MKKNIQYSNKLIMIITRIIKNNANLRLGNNKSNLYSIIFAVPLFLFILFLNSCDTNPVEMKLNNNSVDTNLLELKLNDLKTPCDYVHATNMIIQQIINVKSEKNVDKLINEKKMEELTEKLNKINAAADKKYTEPEFQECDEWKNLTFNSNKLKDMAEKEAKRVSDSIAKATEDAIKYAVEQDILEINNRIQ